MKIAIMQPYFFPYIGYFQLINSVDKFIVYDDVNYIKSGWINRNKILINKEAKYINVQLYSASSNKLINEVIVNPDFYKLLKTIEQNYKRAPSFNDVFPILSDFFCSVKETPMNVAEFNYKGIKTLSEYIGINTVFEFSSKAYPETKELDRTTRILEICRINKADTYINSIGGNSLYSKEDFISNNIDLKFINPILSEYNQFGNQHVPWLSIIDVLMFNSVSAVRSFLIKNNLT